MADFQNFKKVVEDVKSHFFIDTFKKKNKKKPCLTSYLREMYLLTCQRTDYLIDKNF